MDKRIGFDIHGVLDTYPEVFIPMMKAMEYAGFQILIISGPTFLQIRKELMDIGLNDYIYKIKSVVDFLEENGVEFTKDENGNLWCDDETWWDAKARICKESRVVMMIDNDLKYEPAFKLVDDCEFVHISKLLG